MRLVPFLSLLVLIVPSLAGCTGVVPWERDYRLRSWEYARHQAEIAFLKKNYEDALKFQNQALAEAQGLGSQDFRIGITFNEIGLIYQLKKEFDKAEDSYQKAADILQVSVGTTSIGKAQGGPGNSNAEASALDDGVNQRLLRHDLATSLTGLAAMQIERLVPDLKPAKTLLEKATKLEKESWKPSLDSQPDVFAGQQLAKILALSGYASAKQGQLNEAATAYSEALRTARENACYPEDVDEIRDGYRKVLKEQGLPDPWSVDERAWFKHFSAGEEALNAGDLNKAEELYQLSLNDAEKMVPLSVRRSMYSMKRLCQVYKRQNRTNDFIETAQHALTYKTDALTGLAANDLDWILNVYASLIGSPQARLKALSLKVELRTKVFGADDWHVAEALTLVASTLHELGRDGEAKVAARRACEILSGHPKRKRRFADDRVRLATVCENLGEYYLAEKLYRQILHIYIRINRPDDPRTKTATLRLAEMLRRQGK